MTISVLDEETTEENFNLKESTPRKKKSLQQCKENKEAVPIPNEPCEIMKPSTSKPKPNAFELMMSSRNKSIGTNSPGKELVSPSSTQKSLDSTKIKRKLLLEEWADRKGGAKRKLEDAQSKAYIEHQMNKRAKRLKRLVQNGGAKRKEVELSIDEDDDGGGTDVPPAIKFNFKKKDKTKKLTNIVTKDLMDSTKSVEIIEPILKPTSSQPEKDQFVKILSSPIKKRDSLLGYFNKVNKTPPLPSDATSTEPLAKPRRGRPSTNKKTKPREQTPPPSNDSTTNIGSPTTNTNGRPKRNCRSMTINYNIDNDISPAKMAAQKSLKRAKILLNSPSPTKLSARKQHKKKQSETTPTSVSRKLAPIFVKTIPKPIEDPEVAIARHNFLMSGIPDVLKLEMERQRAFEQNYECEHDVFPLISHVTQLMESENHCPISELTIKYTIRSEPEQPSPTKLFKKFRCGPTISFYPKIAEPKNSHRPINHHTDDFKDLVRWLKENDDQKFPYYRCFKQMRNKNVNTKPECQEFIEVADDSQDASVEIINDSPSELGTNGHFMFTEKYKPTGYDEVLVNLPPVIELKRFLSNWLSNQRPKSTSSSDDDFSFGNSSSLPSNALNQSIVLVGPSGCGKTNAVHALAKEMNFKVFEINAGSKRTGKKILRKLQEATQSHQVKSGGVGSVGDPLFKLASSEEFVSSGNVTPLTSSQPQKLSLILIEDADILFEQDLGFIDAINQLVTTSKRPVILIANQESCSHLSRFISHNVIRFRQGKSNMASKWLSMVSITEKCYISSGTCAQLYQHNKSDLRRTLLEMQFFIQSGGDTSHNERNKKIESPRQYYQHQELYNFYTTNQNESSSSSSVPCPVDFNVIQQSHFGHILNSQNDLNQLSQLYDDISVSQWLHQRSAHLNDCIANNNLMESIVHDVVERIYVRETNQFAQNSIEETTMGTTKINERSRYF